MYAADLTGSHWERLLPTLVRFRLQGGRPPKQDVRQEIKAVLYVLKTRCQWRQLPHDFSYWSQVYACFRRWRLVGGNRPRAFQDLRDEERLRMGKTPKPSVAIIDSQSAKTTR